MYKSSVNQHLQFVSDFLENNTDLPFSDKKYKVQIIVNNKFPFLEMNISCSPKSDLQFGVFWNKWQELKYIRKLITHTPGTLRVIPFGFLNCL